MKLKKIFSNIVLPVILFVTIFSSFTFAPLVAQGATDGSGVPVIDTTTRNAASLPNQTTPTPAASGASQDPGGCSLWPQYFSLRNCLLNTFANVGTIIQSFFAWLVWAAAKFMNIAIAIQNGAFHDQPLINVGWQIARDVVNIFYIFILLIIALSMIIGYTGYGSRQMLVSLLLSAVFVNFSLAFTGIIVDLSNVLGNTFYEKMGAEQDVDLRGLNVPYKRDISVTLTKGFAIQKSLQVRGQWSPTDSGDIILNIIIMTAMSVILMAIMVFVFLAGAFMLLGRILDIWILMIFSPLAFLAWVLPQTRSYFGQWMSRLISSSFFYPAMMFMLYLVLTAIDGGVIQTLFGIREGFTTTQMFDSQAAQNYMGEFISKVNLILGFIFLAMLTMTSIIVAKSMGGVAAKSGMSAFNNGTKRAKGWARSGASRLGEYGNRAADRAGISGAASQAGARAAAIPLIGKPIARGLSASQKKAGADREAQAQRDATLVKGLPPLQAAAMMRNLSASAKAQAWKGMNDDQKRQTVKSMSGEDQKQLVTQIAKHYEEKKDIRSAEATKREVAVATGNIQTAMRLTGNGDRPDANASDADKKKYQDNVNAFVKSLGEKDLLRMDKETIENDRHFRKALVDNEVDIKKLSEAKEGTPEEVRKAYQDFSKALTDVDNLVEIKHGVKQPAAGDQFAAAAYQKLVMEEVSKMDDKAISRISADTIRSNTYFQNAMAERFNGKDVMRLAGSQEKAEALRDLFKAMPAAFAEGLSKNAELRKAVVASPGVQTIIYDGSIPSRRDLDQVIDQDTLRDLKRNQNPPAGNAPTPRPTPPPPPPTNPPSAAASTPPPNPNPPGTPAAGQSSGPARPGSPIHAPSGFSGGGPKTPGTSGQTP